MACGADEWRVVESKGRPKLDHPVFQKLCIASGEVNSLSNGQIKERLRSAGLAANGQQNILVRRLKAHMHRAIVAAEKEDCPADVLPPTNPLGLDYLVVIDFEATCKGECPKNWLYEIIEFPALLLNMNTLRIDDEFHCYCRPVLEPTLTPFCKQLTYITQEQVSTASPFPDVFEAFQKWLESHQLGTIYSFLLVTDSPWDIRSCLHPQCVLTSVPLPSYARNWIDMRKLFSQYYRLPRMNIEKMLEHLALQFEGHPHSGIDDARNICRIVCKLIRDGCSLKPNCSI